MGRDKKNKKYSCGYDCGCEHGYEQGHDSHFDWKNELRYIQEQLELQVQMQQQFQEQIMEQFQAQQVQEEVYDHQEVTVVKAKEEFNTKVEEARSSKHTYINVWSRVNQVIGQNNLISFERNGPLAGCITRMNNQSLLIEEAGDYLISLAISFTTDRAMTETDSVALFINEMEIPFSQSRFAARSTCLDDVNHVFQINGTGIYTIPKGATFQVRNVGVNQLDVFSANSANSASLTLVKL